MQPVRREFSSENPARWWQGSPDGQTPGDTFYMACVLQLKLRADPIVKLIFTLVSFPCVFCC